MILAGVVGATFGSFFNVVAWRLPRGESVVKPRSRCPNCGTAIRPYDNVPVLSWLLLRGRCRDCGEPISARYPLVEATTAALWLAVVAYKGVKAAALPDLALVTLLVPVTLIDLEHRIIPNRLLLPFAVIALPLVAATGVKHLPEHAIAGAAAGGFLLAAALAYPRGMGMGDVKLAAVLGLYLGRSVAPAMLIALIAGTVIGAAVIARKGVQAGRKTAVPFGPFLAFGALVAVFAGQPIVHWYLHHFAH